MIEDISFLAIGALLLWFYGFWRHRFIGLDSQEMAHFPNFIHSTIFRGKPKSISGLFTQFLAFYLVSYLLVVFDMLSQVEWGILFLATSTLVMGTLH